MVGLRISGEVVANFTGDPVPFVYKVDQDPMASNAFANMDPDVLTKP